MHVVLHQKTPQSLCILTENDKVWQPRVRRLKSPRPSSAWSASLRRQVNDTSQWVQAGSGVATALAAWTCGQALLCVGQSTSTWRVPGKPLGRGVKRKSLQQQREQHQHPALKPWMGLIRAGPRTENNQRLYTSHQQWENDHLLLDPKSRKHPRQRESRRCS